MQVDYARVNLRAYKQQPSRLEHTVAIDETWVNLYRPPEKDQTKVWLATGEKQPSVVSLYPIFEQFDGSMGQKSHTIWLLDDNARPHRHSSVEAWMDQHNVERWIQPPYSPNLNPCDYGCFHQLKRRIGGVAYPDAVSLRKALNEEIMDGNQHGRYRSVRNLPERWQAVINSQGEYVFQHRLAQISRVLSIKLNKLNSDLNFKTVLISR
ncbi:unnamed protein product [Euphydryas editha]|uniref:Tc1-like transposase DDE domain-containing protein n=1 Tax=Euphydryas editha TaxID=104508 RepID=A0AAU9UTK4_EUPED|nr:unnamed protein product [Euphydryas editha]